MEENSKLEQDHLAKTQAEISENEDEITDIMKRQNLLNNILEKMIGKINESNGTNTKHHEEN